MYMYVHRLYYSATAWNMAMGNVILFRADRLAITIIKKAFIIILSNPRRRQTEVDPIPTSPLPRVPSPKQYSGPRMTQLHPPPHTLVATWSRQSSPAQCGVDNLRLRAPPKNRSHKYAHKATFSIFHFLFDVRHWGRKRSREGTGGRRTLHAIAIAIEFELCQRSNKLLRALN